MSKSLIYLFITIGGIVGSYIPVILMHADYFSIWSILFGAVGSFAGLWIGYKLSQEI